ncbi:MAG: KOW domain-containing RNA-binding protein [Clostridia bacterium]|nr:KOW domain-containing RNA-binding protein [Clostridia bacterium]
MSIEPIGLLAYSKCGRDRKRLFCVVERLDENFVLVADGKLHKIEKPKKKRLKHLSFVECEAFELPLDNDTLYKRIYEYEFSANRRDYSAKG